MNVYDDPNVLPILRELFSQHPIAAYSGAEVLARFLHALRYLLHRPAVIAVEAVCNSRCDETTGELVLARPAP